jgi:UDPglucose--hexose-1-phosphate uridylyltransferase
MPQLRFDYTTADWVVFAPLRQLRPHSRSTATEAAAPTVANGPVASCPFCPGNETMTPREIDAIRTGDDRSAWTVRVVPNKFPALQIEEDHRRTKEGRLFERMGGCGAHEVVIEGREHDLFLGNQPVEQVESVLRILHRRYTDLMRDKRFQAVIVFKNHGEQAGTSLHHPHWQVIATPVVPRLDRVKFSEAADYYDRTGDCLYQVMLDEELQSGERVLALNDDFVAFLPYAGHLPFETWIFPRRAQPGFGMLQPEQIRPLAALLRCVLTKLYVGLDNPDFNLTIETAARGDEVRPFFRWHVRILPRLSTAAGFELGSGMAINTVLPEDAAEFLRAGNGIITPTQ